VTPGWLTGGISHNEGAVKGPLLGLEIRYAPIAGTTGLLSLDAYEDLDQYDSPGGGSIAGEPPSARGRGFGGVRGIAHLAHRTEGEAAVFAVQGTAVSDAMALRDAGPGTLATFLDFLPTDVGLWRAPRPLT